MSNLGLEDLQVPVLVVAGEAYLEGTGGETGRIQRSLRTNAAGIGADHQRAGDLAQRIARTAAGRLHALTDPGPLRPLG